MGRHHTAVMFLLLNQKWFNLQKCVSFRRLLFLALSRSMGGGGGKHKLKVAINAKVVDKFTPISHSLVALLTMFL